MKQVDMGFANVAVEPEADNTAHYPWWFKPSRRSWAQLRNVSGGLHPTGQTLGDESKCCGECNIRTYQGRCGLFPLTVHGSSVWVLKGWRACDQWKETP